MSKKHRVWLVIASVFFAIKTMAIPHAFVYLHDIDPSIKQDIRYAGSHNFIGRPIAGYKKPQCILTRPTAQALGRVQQELLQSGLSLKVYDCYRPQRAVNDFIRWSRDPQDQMAKAEFYPKVDKSLFFKLGYVAAKSGHTRGSTVDLTIVRRNAPTTSKFQPAQQLTACFAPYLQRFRDQGIDMGTGFDCFDPRSHAYSKNINLVAYQHRVLLRRLMQKYGFKPYEKEWWHFTLAREPYPTRYFDFLVS